MSRRKRKIGIEAVTLLSLRRRLIVLLGSEVNIGSFLCFLVLFIVMVDLISHLVPRCSQLNDDNLFHQMEFNRGLQETSDSITCS